MYLKLVHRFLQTHPGWNYVGHSGIFIVYKVKYFGDENNEPEQVSKPQQPHQQAVKPKTPQPEFQYSDDDDD
jgi:hypothetical protein